MIGTSAYLKVGDYLSINSLLFALMLPSGNDAAWALAEYFGSRISPNSVKPVKHFILEMNKIAKELHLPSSSFANPHGLMQKKNLSTARDIAKVTCFAMKNKKFREIVDTRQFTSEVLGQDGVTRFMTWENTNKLLGNSFCGVKTGITDAAGPCLSVCSRGNCPTVVVLLNSRSMEDRWVEARRLIDWVNGKSY
jgi:D-alanyl-D-alanine carboxypeptidase